MILKNIRFRIMKKVFKVMNHKKLKPFFKSIDYKLQNINNGSYYDKIGKLKSRLKYSPGVDLEKTDRKKFENVKWKYENINDKCINPLVSVIVPSYNHKDYLKERLESIYGQTYQNYEVILLDDCSTDGSTEILEYYRQKYPEKTRAYFNSKNTGNIFGQWKKGMDLAKGEIVWIAESDDYCDKNFLKKLVPCFAYESVKIAFSKSVFVQNGRRVGSTEEYLRDLNIFDWEKSFYMTAHEAVKNGFAIHNIIANVSSALIKKPIYIDMKVMCECQKMKLSFDWLFYLYIIRGGSLAYVSDVVAYYRIHDTSTSLRIQKTMQYYKEYEEISLYIAENYKIDLQIFELVKKNLKEHYKQFHGENGISTIESIYSLEKIRERKKERKLNIAMCGYAFQAGGGETFPIYLANALWERGEIVTYIDFHRELPDPRIKKLLRKDIPIVSLNSMDNMYWVIEQLGLDIIHTHHAMSDEAVGCWMLNHSFNCSHVVTLHGIYETMSEEAAKHVLNVVGNSASAYCYVADKNLEAFIREKFYEKEKDRYTKILNGLEIPTSVSIKRETMGIGEEEFVLVLASRGMAEKGWKEAAEAVEKANKYSSKRVRLVILGDGDMKSYIEEHASSDTICVGTVTNVRDYFKMGDMGILPSTYKGESCPLVIIECLQSGKPVIATNIGEISYELMDEKKQYAGELLKIEDGRVNVNDIVEAILQVTEHNEYYKLLKSRCESAAKKFDIKIVCNNYLQVYQNAIENRKCWRNDNEE